MGNNSEQDKAIKFGIQLPPWYERKLRLWAKVKGTTRANLAANVIQSRIEVNWAEIEKEIATIALHRGIKPEELIAEWLNGGEDDD